MAQYGDESKLPSENFGDPPVDVGPLYEPADAYRVLDVHQLIRYPQDGRMIPTIEVEFTVPGLPGLYNRWIDNYAFTHGQPPVLYVFDRANQIREMWAIP